MINNLVNLVQQLSGKAIINNPEIPNEQNNTVIQSATEGIFKGLQNQAMSGGLGQILNMFNSSGNNSISDTLSRNVQSAVVSSLMEKSGIKSGIAKGIASQLVPLVLSALSKHATDPKNSNFNISDILSSLTGGQTKGMDIGSLLDKFAGNGDGKLDLNDVTSFFSKKSSGGKSNEGGIMGALGSLLGGK
ncbi:MAG: DUF937 domain-containing protein [Dysgonamonadaceae bacterium]|jgi:hypothetical protein|nr:DUF937 domain-containing protein [Dysgonamonadaceae bacterium]